MPQRHSVLPLSARFALLLLALSTVLTPLPSEATIGIDPTRVVFEGRARSERVTIINQGAKPATYRVYFRNYRMQEDGSYAEVDSPDAGEHFAERLVRYAPRQITVPPGKTQVVRLLLRKPRDLPEGEYRSHLTIEQLPDASLGNDIESLSAQGVQVRLIARYAVSIPVIVRHGELHADAKLGELALTRNEETAGISVSARLFRDGDSSIYGDFEVVHIGSDGTERSVGLLNGIAVYVPNESRTVTIPLTDLPSRSGVLKLIYRTPAKDGAEVMSEATLPL